MEDFTAWLVGVYQSYGFRAFAVIIATIILTNITKRPIVKAAENYARGYNADKSVVTKWIALLPYGYAFVLNLIVTVIFAAKSGNWDIAWAKYIGDSSLFATVAIAGFEVGKKCLQSYISKKEQKEGK